MRNSWMGVIIVAMALLATGCQSKVADENKALWEQNRQLQAKLTETAAAPKTDNAQLASLQSQLAERDQKLAELQTGGAVAAGQPRQLIPVGVESPHPGIAGVETSYDKASGKMTVNVPGDVLFAPGDATVREEAKSTLDKVANSLKRDYAAKRVRVDGHTDSTPIRVSKWKSNLDLSQARADAVKAYLVKKGIDPALISTKGFGSEQPKAKDKSLNRRVEIVVATR
jgi:outer membrane protein OmpA-like peptidoglycan-associated protein